MFRNIVTYAKGNIHHLSLVFFIAGFIFDNLTLSRVDNVLDNAILAGYAFLMMVSALLLYASSAAKTPERVTPFLKIASPFALQFTFGGLLSGLLVFYWRSGSITASWPFLLIIVAVFVGNELFRDRVRRLVLNLSIIYVGIFSYSVLIVPVIVKRMSDMIFVASSIVSLVVFAIFLRVLRMIVPNFLRLHIRGVVFSVGCICVAFQGLYFANLIPPIPLSLKQIGIYHEAQKLTDGRYLLSYERASWYQPFRKTSLVFHLGDGEPERPRCFASVFAPTKLYTDLFFLWEFYNTESGKWTEYAKIPYSIVGGREGGYRGYSYITAVQKGKYRCSIITERGQKLGHETFWVESGSMGTVSSRVE